MSYDNKLDEMDWSNEISWLVISLVSGLILSVFFIQFDRFPNVNPIALTLLCCIGFYVLGILVRAQNQRGKVLTGKPATNEKYLKFIFPLVGFAVGAFLLLY